MFGHVTPLRTSVALGLWTVATSHETLADNGIGVIIPGTLLWRCRTPRPELLTWHRLLWRDIRGLLHVCL